MRAKFIYEKFTEDSDPIYDMGIGIKHDIEKCADLIKKLDFDKTETVFMYKDSGLDLNSWHPVGRALRGLSINTDDKKIIFKFYLNRYKYSKTGKLLDKKKYALELLTKAGILSCINKNSKIFFTGEYTNESECIEIIFTIKKEYIKYFKNIFEIF
jgi:hypothetical protein